MSYSYEFKRKCVEIYRKGIWMETPEGITQKNFRITIRRWCQAETEYLKAENEVIKKEIALREEKRAALLKAKKQRLSKNYANKDIP